MSKRRRLLIGVGGSLVALLVCVLINGGIERKPALELPFTIGLEGVPKGASDASVQGWLELKPQNVPVRVTMVSKMARLIERLGGSASPQVSSAPQTESLIGNFSRIAFETGDTILLAREFFPEGSMEHEELMLIYDDTANRADGRTWIEDNFRGLLENGVQVWRYSQPGTNARKNMVPVSTNSAALVRDERNVIKVIPVNRLQSYAAAGMIDPKVLK